MIEITLNAEEMTVPDTCTVRQLLVEKNWPSEGIAVSVNSTVFPVSNWDEILSPGAVIDILAATQGG